MPVRLGRPILVVYFIVCNKLAAPIILDADFRGLCVGAIFPRRRIVELHDSFTVPITVKPLQRSGIKFKVHEEHQAGTQRRSSSKVQMRMYSNDSAGITAVHRVFLRQIRTVSGTTTTKAL